MSLPAREVFYVPLPGQKMTPASVAVTAREETLLTHDGSAQHEWSGVTFEWVALPSRAPGREGRPGGGVWKGLPRALSLRGVRSNVSVVLRGGA